MSDFERLERSTFSLMSSWEDWGKLYLNGSQYVILCNAMKLIRGGIKILIELEQERKDNQ